MADAPLRGRATIGIVHPGEMGAALGRCFVARGHRVIWASESRGERTRDRALRAGLEDVGDLTTLAADSDLVISVVPPQAAAEVARAVGPRCQVFVDANAISPQQAAHLRTVVEHDGGHFVDGSVVGAPPTDDRPVRLFLSGPGADAAAEVLGGGAVQTVTLEGASAASALKMSYAAWTKGAQALLLAGLAAARAHGVEAELLEEWARSQPDLEQKAQGAAAAAARKGWRWSYEMQEISRTFREVGLPAGLHEAAAWVFEHAPRDEDVKPGIAALEAVLDRLAGPTEPEA